MKTPLNNHAHRRRIVAARGFGFLFLLLTTGFNADVAGSISEDEMLPARRGGNASAEQLAARYLGDNFASSLVSKEFVDFLLTPALVVQEVISEDAIITYPSE